MKTLEWTTIDKAAWGPGEWQREPDKKQWRDEATGLPCLAVRNGHWCGYVGVSAEHPWHGVSYSGCARTPACEESYCEHAPESAIRVHGGLTFSDKCADVKGDHSRFICHLPEPGEPDNVWWFGFDCGHSGDLSPQYAAKYSALGHGVYRDLAYVERQCAELARQLKAAAVAP